ncbi:DUF4554 domain-containing protein [Megalops cyprinoides]|uniref:DUF4554 domain-containing protein n=1 Tax=Megalops cyprinoides TaxID=118141 RepID=UPI001863CCE9|nr:DUF4554 domain-containing protein [Megalops cyprinoides]
MQTSAAEFLLSFHVSSSSCRPDRRFPLEGACVLVDSTPCLRTVSLLLPPEVAETGLCGETSLVPLATLSPCVAQYPNQATHLTRICCLCSEMVYIVDGDLQQSPETVQRAVTEQTLVLFVFIQHRDPFHSQLSDFIAGEEVLQRHLDQILLHNTERVKSALYSVLESTLMGLQRRQQAQRKLCSALPVILSSVCSVVTSSSSLGFRTTCLDRMMEDMFWLQEISNMCEWELWGP